MTTIAYTHTSDFRELSKADVAKYLDEDSEAAKKLRFERGVPQEVDDEVAEVLLNHEHFADEFTEIEDDDIEDDDEDVEDDEGAAKAAKKAAKKTAKKVNKADQDEKTTGAKAQAVSAGDSAGTGATAGAGSTGRGSSTGGSTA